MPYSGPGDSTLPPRIQKLALARRRQWVGAFNGAFGTCKGSKRTCEGRAFRIANASIKELGMKTSFPVQCAGSECEEFLHAEVGQKEMTCEHCGTTSTLEWPDSVVVDGGLAHAARDEAAPAAKSVHLDQPHESSHDVQAVAVVEFQILGGATSFQEADDFDKAERQNSWVRDQEELFHMLFGNIMGQDEVDLAVKVREVANLAAEMGGRVQNVQTKESGGSVSLWERMKSVLGGGKEPFKYEGPPFFKISDLESDHETDLLGQRGAFYVTKDLEGNPRWLAVVSNKFYDREKEVFCEAAHREYVAWVDRTKEFPLAQVWHMPGSAFGVADFVSYSDGFLVESGTFYDKQFAENLAAMGELGVSHGYFYDPKDLDEEGVYRRYRQFEMTVLPPERAANLWTAFRADASLKEVSDSMAMDPEKKEFLVKVFGEERATAVEEGVQRLTKTLEGAGIGWKDLSEELAVLDAASPAAKSTPAATAASDDEEEPKTATAESAPTAGDAEQPAPEAANGDLSGRDALATELAGIREGLQTQGKNLDDKFSAIEERLAGLEKTDDAKVAATISPRATAGGPQRPSQSTETEVPDEATKGLLQADDDKSDDPNNPARAYVDDMLGVKRAKEPAASA